MKNKVVKRLLCVLIVCCLIQGLAACKSNDDQSETTHLSTISQQLDEAGDSQRKENDNTLIVYFSLWDNASWGEATDTDTSASVVVSEDGVIGTNGYVARLIQKTIGGDIQVLRVSQLYAADFDAVVARNHQENSVMLSDAMESLEQYDTVFIGYPIWATTIPPAVDTFLRTYDFAGKTVIPFCTHDGYGAGSTFSTIAQLATGAETLQGLSLEAVNVPTAQETINQWLEDLGFIDDIDDEKRGEIPIRVLVGDIQPEGVLYDSSESHQFIDLLPQTISMINYGGREVYGGIDGTITVEREGQFHFENGDITYCPSNHSVAIFYAQTDRPNLTMEVYPIGRITSNLSVFDTLDSRVNVTFELIK